MKRLLRTEVVIAALALVSVVFFEPMLAAFGDYLVRTEAPQKADIVLVLAGDGWGHRILSGAQLAKEGYAPKVFVSGPSGAYGRFECDLAIPFAIRNGFDEPLFVHAEHDGRSTAAEAELLIPKLRSLGARKILLVTSNYHTRRAGRLFRASAPDLQFYVIAAPDQYFSPRDWWRHREARKTFLMEWEKTVAAWIGL